MHQRRKVCEETVHDKETLRAESWVQAFEIAGMIILNAMTQYQVLSASGRTDGSAEQSESVESTFSVVGLKDCGRRQSGAIGQA